ALVMSLGCMTKAHMRITSLADDGTATDDGDDDNGVEIAVDWSVRCGTEFPELADDAEISIPDNLVPAGGTIIMAEIRYPYSSPIGFFFNEEKMLSDTFYLRPRRVDSISHDDSTGTLTCGYTP
ncbi:MAG: hypothetical protein AAFV59_13795, partial [Pseudomonadota bacterium]